MNNNQNTQQIEQQKGKNGKFNIPLAVVSIIAIVLCVLSIVLKTKMDDQKVKYDKDIEDKKTELIKTREILTEVREVNTTLT